MQLQSLNLSRPPVSGANQLIQGRPIRIFPDGNIIEGYFTFTMASSLDDIDERRSNVRDLRICKALGEHLHQTGFQVGKVRPAKPRGGIFGLTSDKLKVTVIISAAKKPPVVKCSVLTWTRALSEGIVVEAEWTRIIEGIERSITQNLDGQNLVWSLEDDPTV